MAEETKTAEAKTAETKTAEAKTAETKTATKEKREKIFIPKGYVNDEPNLFVSVNGVNYLLPKGKESEVPKHVADEIRRSWKAQAAMDQRIDQMLEASK